MSEFTPQEQKILQLGNLIDLGKITDPQHEDRARSIHTRWAREVLPNGVRLYGVDWLCIDELLSLYGDSVDPVEVDTLRSDPIPQLDEVVE